MMQDLSKATRTHIEFAAGYLQLGMSRQAEAELKAIASHERGHPAVLVVELDVAMEQRQWMRARRLAARLRTIAPGLDAGWLSGAYAERRAARGPNARKLGLLRARAILLEAEPRLGARCPMLHYNLACYAAQLGDLNEAQARLAKAVAMDPAYAEIAKSDEDLAPLGL